MGYHEGDGTKWYSVDESDLSDLASRVESASIAVLIGRLNEDLYAPLPRAGMYGGPEIEAYAKKIDALKLKLLELEYDGGRMGG